MGIDGLLYACIEKFAGLDVIKYLVEDWGAEPHSDTWWDGENFGTPMKLAIKLERKDIVEYFNTWKQLSNLDEYCFDE